MYPYRDKQQDEPLFYCSRCGGEIYPYDSAAKNGSGGEIVHEECVRPREADYFAFYPAISLIQEIERIGGF